MLTQSHPHFWEFELGEKVKVAGTKVTGQVVGRAEHLFREDEYQIRQVFPTGEFDEIWYPASLLAPVDRKRKN